MDVLISFYKILVINWADYSNPLFQYQCVDNTQYARRIWNTAGKVSVSAPLCVTDFGGRIQNSSEVLKTWRSYPNAMAACAGWRHLWGEILLDLVLC